LDEALRIEASEALSISMESSIISLSTLFLLENLSPEALPAFAGGAPAPGCLARSLEAPIALKSREKELEPYLSAEPEMSSTIEPEPVREPDLDFSDSKELE